MAARSASQGRCAITLRYCTVSLTLTLTLNLLLLGCSSTTKPTVFTHTAGPRSYLALGDSYTIGEGVDQQQRWPTQLVKALKEQNIISLDDPIILARTGWTTDDLQQAMDEAKLTGPYRLVSLMIGVNDQYKHGTPEQFRPALVKLIQQAIKLAGGKAEHVLVLSIPDYDFGPYRKFAPQKIGESIDQFNMVCKEEATRLGAVYVDVTEISRQAKGKPELWAGDQLHFAGGMHTKWVEAMLPTVVKMAK